MAIIGYGSQSGADLNVAYTKLKQAFSLGLALYKDQPIDEVALIDTVSKDRILQVDVSIDGSGYVFKGLTDDTDYSENPGKPAGTIGYRRIDLFAYKWGEQWSPVEKMRAMQSMARLAGKPRKVALIEACKLLQSNPTIDFDGQPLFSASHVVDPFGDTAITHANDIVQPFTSAGWNAVMQAIMTRKDPGSKASKPFLPNAMLDPNQITIWTGDTGVYSTLDKIFDPRSIYAGTAASETLKVYANASMRYVAEMAVLDAANNATKHVYVIVKSEEQPALYMRVPDMPRVEPIERVNPHVSRVKAWQTFGIAAVNPFAIYRWRAA
mgnify:CR=1 FL=1